MKNAMRLFACMTLAGALALTACDEKKDDNSSLLMLLLGGGSVAGDIDMTFESAVQTGGDSGTADSTGLTLTFDVDPATLTEDNITVSGATKGALSGSGTTRSLAISDITVANGATVTVTITSPEGYSITGSPRTAVVYRLFFAGYKEACAAAGVSYDMVYVPGGLTFPRGTNDETTANVADAYWIGETEVTYELWSAVYEWATSGTGGATGEGEYIFANAGGRGGYFDGSWMVYDTGHETHPVTYVNWRDSMVWCNALTEWYNAHNGTGYECVYTYDGGSGADIIRDSSDGNATACDNAAASSTAKGFRLLTGNEYELAARYRDGTLWTYGDHASGDESGACYDDGDILGGLGMSTVFGDYAFHAANSGQTTAAVASKTPNALGLYDMSGNVWEWCFDLSGVSRIISGGSWRHTTEELRVGYRVSTTPYDEFNFRGFRIARTR